MRAFFGEVVKKGVQHVADGVTEVRDTLHAVFPAAAKLGEPLPAIAALERFLAHYRLRTTEKSYETNRVYLERFFQRVNVRDLRAITPSRIEEYLDEQVEKRDWKPRTYNRAREILHTLFAYFVRLELVLHNPVSKVPRMSVSAPLIRYLDPGNIETLLRVVKQDELLYPIVSFLLFTGCRRGEAVWVEWSDLNTAESTVAIRAKAGWQPKTKRDRVVPISPKLREILLEHKKSARASNWMFTGPTNLQWNGDNLHHRYRALLREHGLPWTILDLRHTFASTLVQRGVSIEKVAALMGNSPFICHRHYAKLRPEILHDDVAF